VTNPLPRLAEALEDRYRIERELGQGGMATVYLADDLRHRRKVALKVLRPELAAVIGAERFLHEITTTASLQHPHILPLHDSGQVDGTVYYVMPFVPGESLRDRLSREKQLPVDDAVRIAREVASALDYAHRHGVIHRDIKPENILLHDGAALVADFGIALAASHTGSSRMTETGMSLGTPHYMSPEQAMGERELGPRSDVYALGCVCYEMLSGEPPFTGPTPQAIVARVMTDPPRSLRSQRPTVPEHVEAAVLQALEKLPADRFGTAAAFAEALAQPGFTRTMGPSRAVGSTPRSTAWRTVAFGLAGLAVLLAVALVVAVRRPAGGAGVPGPVFRAEIRIPDSIPVEQVALFPDGTRLLVQTSDRSYIYSFADMRWTRLAATELKDIAVHAISPDSRWVAFVDDGRRLNIVPIAGGAVRTIADSVRAATWEADEFLYLIRQSGGRDRIVRVSPGGGALEELLVADSGRTLHLLGPMLPGGRFLYTISPGDPRSVATLALDLSDRTSLPLSLPPGTDPIGYAATGHLVLYGGDGLYAIGLDLERLAVIGSPVKLVSVLPLSASVAAGMLAYHLAPAGGPMLFDRRGNSRELPGAIVPNSWGWGARVSPSGHALAFWQYRSADNRWDVFSYRLPAGPLTRLTSDPEGLNRVVAWAPDGRTVRFLSSREGQMSLFHATLDGSGPVEPVLARPASLRGLASLLDGRMVIEEQGKGLLLVRPGSTDSAITLVGAASTPRFPSVSPDGQWLAYTAIELGRREVFVRPLDGGSRRWQISRNGGSSPAWARSGRELFFYQGDSIRVAAVRSRPEFQSDEPRALFRVALLPDYSGFDVLPGDSLLVVSSNARGERDRVFVVVNFLEELRGLTAITQK
jgi:serine/threonine-protein kinase